MVNKNIVLVSLIVFSVIFLTGVVFAFSWSDFITGKATNPLKVITWVEGDGGIDEFEADVIYSSDNKRWKVDTCYAASSKVKEWYLDNGNPKSRNIKCLNGCENKVIELPFGSQTAGECKTDSNKFCEEFGDEGDDPFTAGVVLSNSDSKQVANDKDSSNSVTEYYCDENNVRQEKSYPCYGKIEKEFVQVTYNQNGLNVNNQYRASYCVTAEISCSKEGKVLTYTMPNGEEKTKTDRCATSDNEEDEGAQAGEGSKYIVSFECNLEDYDLNSDDVVNMEDLALDEDGTNGVLGVLTGETKPYVRNEEDSCDNGCKATETEVMCKDPSCVDSDSRKNLEVAGITQIKSQSGITQFQGNDACVGSDRVLEYWCSSGNAKFLTAKTFQCPTGKSCLAGACV